MGWIGLDGYLWMVGGRAHYGANCWNSWKADILIQQKARAWWDVAWLVEAVLSHWHTFWHSSKVTHHCLLPSDTSDTGTWEFRECLKINWIYSQFCVNPILWQCPISCTMDVAWSWHNQLCTIWPVIVLKKELNVSLCPFRFKFKICVSLPVTNINTKK